ncbi:hypothetical protein HNR23_004740 [Nocardiopsis mwathae]|uniref:Terpene synthase n=1 Tax=Nocardiopsis mwathae TaxID=1472723 RepID=A0A7X0D7T4_9ACTN|nr:terpene synthase family protein [Nocardiopsis mwathae]MBB6174680.1 hypothetical protein [Nocardiopsis mwathae]
MIIDQDLSIELLHFALPIPSAINPEAEKIAAHTQAWVQHHNLGGTPEKNRSAAIAGADLTIHGFPESRGPVATFLSDYNALGYTMNDHIYTDPPHRDLHDVVRDVVFWERMLYFPHTHVPDDITLRDAVRDIARRVRTDIPASVQQAFLTGTAHWCSALALESSIYDRHHPMSVSEYLRLRHAVIGDAAFSGEICVGNTTAVPTEEWHDPAVRAVIQAGTLIFGLDNDRYSQIKDVTHRIHVKDRTQHTRRDNLITVMARESSRSTPQEVVREAVRLRDRVFSAYLRLQQRVRRTASPPLQRFLTSMDYCLVGHITVGCGPRYFPDGPPPFTISTEMPDVPLGVPPYPSIAWWWDHIDHDHA